MNRAIKFTALAAVGLAGFLILAAAIVVLGANTGPGRRAVEALVSQISGGEMTVLGLAGRFPDKLHARELVLHDAQGAYARFDDVTLDWAPWTLVTGTLKIDRLAAADATLDRLPRSGSGGGTALPPLRIADLSIARLQLGPAVAGEAAAVKIDGHLELASPSRGSAALEVARLDAPGSYRADLTLTPAAVTAELVAKEPGHGLIGGLAGLPNLGPLAIEAHLAGPRAALKTDVSLAAGPLRAKAQGTIDLDTRRVELTVTGTAPAMAPKPGLSWHSANLDARVSGPIAQPDVTANLTVDHLVAAGGTIRSIAAKITGVGGAIRLEGELSGLRVPGRKPDLFATAPVTVTAQAMLREPTRPVVFSVTAPAIDVQGSADTKGKIAGKLVIRLSSLAPVAALTAFDLKGNAALDANFAEQSGALRIDAQGRASVTGGARQAVQLLGPDARFGFAGSVGSDKLVVDKASLDGRALHASLEGKRAAGTLDFAYRLGLSDLAALASNATGSLDATGKVTGPENDFVLTSEARGTIGAKGVAPGLAQGPVEISLVARDLPDAPAVQIGAKGKLAGAPLDLAARIVGNGKGGVDLAIDRAQWKSASIDGHLVLPTDGSVPEGKIRLRVARLQDLAPFVGATWGGKVDATVEAIAAPGAPRGKTDLAVQGVAQAVVFDGRSIGRVTLGGRIADPLSHPVLALKLGLDDIAANDVTGRASITANGPIHALALHLDASATTGRGPARLAAAATLDLGERRLNLAALDASIGGVQARLLAPSAVDFRNGVTLHDFRIGLGNGVIAATGRLSPQLDLDLSARDLDPGVAQVFLPQIELGGKFAVRAQLAGAWAAPDGTVRITGQGLRARGQSSGGLPPADVSATFKLAKGNVTIDATLASGAANRLQVKGVVSLRAGRKIDLRGTGALDLALFDPFLAAGGRTLQGHVALDARVAGTFAKPVATGHAELSGGAFRDYVRGIHMTDMAGLVDFEGDTLRLARFSGKSGPGTVSASGTVKLAQGLPLALKITLKNAEPIATDLVTARMDGDIDIKGSALARLNVAGRIHVDRASINIPDTYPKSVAILDVQAEGEGRQRPPPRIVIGLDLTVDAPGRIFVRGHGLTAELGGRIVIRGTSEKPEVAGSFKLVRGDLAVVSQPLTLTDGTVSFDGQSFAGRLDPALDFTAQTTANGITATLRLTGYADRPQILLTSSPSLPQSEILSLLLFGQETAHLSALQAAQLAQALASLSGVGGGLDPLGMLRKDLGLDRLSVAAGATPTSAPTVQAGKYITPNVYVGAKQGKLGTTQAEVQINLTKNLKLSTTVAAGSGAPATGAGTDSGTGSTVGLTYQFEY